MTPKDVTLHRAPDAATFYERCWDFLLSAEAEHNLILGFSAGLISGDHAYDSPIYLAWLEEGGEVIGYVFRTPPFKVGVSRLPAAAVPMVERDLAEVYDSIPAVMGPPETARALAEAWAGPRGLSVEKGMEHRIHLATTVDPAASTAPGRMRRAEVSDTELCIAWGRAFSEEAGVQGTDPTIAIPRMVEAGALVVWEVSGEVVSMAAASAATPNGARVAWVYTPPEIRGNGYATSCVAGLTEHLLATGKAASFLYTDLANPTSNAIYHRIGYRPVTDTVDFQIR